MMRQKLGNYWATYRTRAIKVLMIMAPLVSSSYPGQALGDTYIATMPELIITATRIPTHPAHLGSSITVIDENDFAKRQSPLVEEILRDVPGLAVTRTGNIGSFSEVRIRGAEGNQTLVLIDGMEVNDPGLGSNFDFGGLLTDTIERIEILRGPQSTLYGGDAMGGVINILTKKGTGPLSTSALVETGSFGSRRTSARMSESAKYYAFSLGGSFYRTNGISQADEDNGNGETDGYKNRTVIASGRYQTSDHSSIEALFRAVDFSVETDPQEFNLDTFTFSRPADGSQQTDTLERQGIAVARLDLLGGHLENILRVQKTIRYLKEIKNNDLNFISDSERSKIDYQGNIHLNEMHTLIIGLEAENEKIDTSFQTATDVGNNATFGEYLLNFPSNVNITAGARVDDHQSFGRETTHRFTGSYLFEDANTRIRGSYGTGFKAPTLNDLFGLGGNPDLQPETAEGWDIGVVQTFPNALGTFEFIYFRTKINNVIQFGAQGLVNSGKSIAEGIESTLSIHATPILSATFSYTWTNSKDLSTGLELIRRPRHIASTRITWDFHPNAKSTIGLRYGGRRDDFDFTLPSTNRQITLSSHTLVDLSLSYEINRDLRLFGRIENLFDNHYQEVVDYGNPGISAYAGLQKTF